MVGGAFVGVRRTPVPQLSGSKAAACICEQSPYRSLTGKVRWPIPSNVAEGHTRREGAYLNHVKIALGSQAELGTEVELAEIGISLFPTRRFARIRYPASQEAVVWSQALTGTRAAVHRRVNYSAATSDGSGTFLTLQPDRRPLTADRRPPTAVRYFTPTNSFSRAISSRVSGVARSRARRIRSAASGSFNRTLTWARLNSAIG